MATAKKTTAPKSAKAAAPKSSKSAKAVTFGLSAPEGSSVYVAGSFNNWDPQSTPLAPTGTGSYCATVELPKGRYEYKFVVNNEWQIDPECPSWSPNEFGSLNSVIEVQ